jgi:hypothetical protein
MTVAKLDPKVEEALSKQVAALSLEASSPATIAKGLNVSVSVVKRIMASDSFKDHLKEVAEATVTSVLNRFKARTERLEPKAQAALERLLDSDKGRDAAEGLKIFFRIAGLDKLDPADQGPGNITINLPGQTQEKSIDVTPQEDEDDGT